LENERKQAAEQAKENARLERERVAAEGAEKAAIRAEVETLIQETNSPKELLEEYNGKEDELLKTLREKKAKQIAEEDEMKESRAKKDASDSDAKVTPSDEEIAKMDKMERVRLKMEKAKAERAEYMAFMRSQA